MSCLLLSANIYAEEVSILNQGACWISDSPESLKVASFNEAKSYTVQKENLDSLFPIFKEIGVKLEESTSIQAFGHCSAMGMRHVFKVNFESGLSYCLWSQFDKGEFKKIDLDLAEADYNGICDGIIFNKLLISPNKEFSLQDLLSEFANLNIQVKNTSKIANNIFAVEFSVKNNEIFEIYNKTYKNNKFRFVDFVTRQRPIGDIFLSEALSIEK